MQKSWVTCMILHLNELFMIYKRIPLIIILLTILSCSVKAQRRFDLQRRSEFSIGLEGTAPSNGWNYGAGMTLKYVYNINHLLACSFQTGYIFFPGKETGSIKLNAGQIPLKAGLRIMTHHL